MDFKPDFSLTSVSGRITLIEPDRLGPLADLVGTWKGHGFNQIWRPLHGGPPGQDRFLELNETDETLGFDEIPGDIPNRGLLQHDINLHGIRYLQQIQDANVPGPNGKRAGIHVEPGLWVHIPSTTNPADPSTFARLANIPHGTSFVAQGTELPTIDKAPPIQPVSITPFKIGNPASLVPFPESNLTTATAFRTKKQDIPNVTQAMVDNPNSVLTAALAGEKVISTTTLRISTTPLNPPTTGGGAANIAFLQGTAGGPNAQAAGVDAIFWIEKIEDAAGKIRLQLQYSQRVLLNFNTLSWPHVSVATLVKQ
jgi:hypothetical protein